MLKGNKKVNEHIDGIITEIVTLNRFISSSEEELSIYGEMLLTMHLLRLKSDINYINKCLKFNDVFYRDEYPL